jgi:hypothetical protein
MHAFFKSWILRAILPITLGAAFSVPLFPQTPSANELTAPAGSQQFPDKGAPQAAPKSGWPPSGPTPHTADGKPDLSGAWAPNAIRQNVDMIATGVRVPFQPWAEKLYNERKESHAKDDPEARCLPPGVPRMTTTPYPFRIMETPGLTLIVYEGGAHIWRQIFDRPLGRRCVRDRHHRTERSDVARRVGFAHDGITACHRANPPA